MILIGDAFEKLKAIEPESVQTCVTSPPYWGLRDYGVDGQLGLEKTPDEYVEKLVRVFQEVRRVLKNDGTLWLNLGDSYATSAGSVGKCPGGGKQGENWKLRGKMTPPNRMPILGYKPKDLVGVPWRVAFALQKDGWYLRQDIIWHKPNPMPESVRDRCTKAHEYIFLLSKSSRYCFDYAAIKEPATGRPCGNTKRVRLPDGFTDGDNGSNRGALHKIPAVELRNKRSVWTITPKPFKGAHFATFPKDLITPCILAGSRPGDTVLDPFAGAGTTWLVCNETQRKFIGIEINKEYAAMAEKRVFDAAPLFAEVP